jgi:tetratricopeptide (TPR) repeat protein
MAQDPLNEPGFQHFYNLEYEQALAAFEQKAAKLRSEPSPQNHIAQTLLFQSMLENGALESDLIGSTNPFASRPKLPVSAERQKRFENAVATAISLAQAKLNANANDVQALYSMGVALGLRANWNYLVHKAWIDPLRDATHARKLHLQATTIDPNFHDARLVQGVHDYLIGSLPLGIKMMGFLAGFRGDREEGMRTIRTVFDKGSTNRIDAAILLSAILRREKRQAEAIPLLAEAVNRFPKNHLFRFELGLLHADVGDRTKALAQVDAIAQLRSKGQLAVKQVTAERVDYMRGYVLFQLREYDAAIPHLVQATRGAASNDTTSTAQAWLRLGQAYDAKGRRAEAMNAYKQAVHAGPQTSYAREAKDYLSTPFKHRHA